MVRGILWRVPDAAAEFSSSAALPILREACHRAELGSGGAELLRIGENAIFRLASAPVVVRISRSADRLPRVRREICVARWLAAANVPAVRIEGDIQQPMMVDSHPVTFWRAVTGGALRQTTTTSHVCWPPTTPPRTARATLQPSNPADLGILPPMPRASHPKALISSATGSPTSRNSSRTWSLRCRSAPPTGTRTRRTCSPTAARSCSSTSRPPRSAPANGDLLPTSIAVQRYGLPEEKYREFAAGFALRVASLRDKDRQRAWHFF